MCVQKREQCCLVTRTVSVKSGERGAGELGIVVRSKESDADMTRPKSEGRPNYCNPRCPTSMILSALPPPPPPPPSSSFYFYLIRSRSQSLKIPVLYSHAYSFLNFLGSLWSDSPVQSPEPP
ncbi:hypothetical protein OIU85_009017 [Salix viminalis]|uniref:Uncharacterized protein n=1 Tax=Salix viminalis TaxID=40686 RepID=A0A9Q0NZ82_SALVM|nr:hypothetical protein OIU85_009017 [Salix viminalis]